jgi:hypothetical protein
MSDDSAERFGMGAHSHHFPEENISEARPGRFQPMKT